MLLFLQIVEAKPPSLAAVIGIGISWVAAIITIMRFRMDLAKARRELQNDAEALARRTCEEYISSKDYAEKRDARVKELIAIATAAALDKYGPTFASAESKVTVEQRFAALEKDVGRIRSILDNRVSFK